MTSRWNGRVLVSEGTREFPSGAADVRETIELSEDGKTLEVAIAFSGPDGEATTTLRYGRIRDVGPCESWPSPCTDPSRPRQ